MANKYIELENGSLKEKEASSISNGAIDAGKIPALDSDGKLDPSLLPPGIGEDLATIEASEDLDAGDLVNVYDDAGVTKVRKANASIGLEAHGFILSAALAGESKSVYFEGNISGLSGLTVGSKYFLSSVIAGAVDLTPPTLAGELVQRIGTAISSTNISFEPSDPITLA